VLRGLQDGEDAGVYQLSEDLALVQTVDFFTPIVDDPREFGRIAAANALSDVYAMGGRPVTALNVAGFPSDKLDIGILQEIFAGGADTLREAGVALVGGHTVKDAEPKYGLSVTGLVDPRRMLTNDGLRPGDCLVLTKPIGTGIIGKALKEAVAEPESVAAQVTSMRALNRAASEVAVALELRACTDVTGFGLLGHLAEMVRASGVHARVRIEDVPLLPGVLLSVVAGLVPAGSRANAKHFGAWVGVADGLDTARVVALFDAQTSGGLLLGVPAERLSEAIAALGQTDTLVTAVIGDVVGESDLGRIELI